LRIGALVSDGPGWRAVGYGLLKVPLAIPEGYGAFCYVFGLAAMHTVGHAGMQMSAGVQVMPGSTATLVARHVAPGAAVQPMVAAVMGGCADDGCADPSHHGGGPMSGWSICLAVMSGVAVIVLLAASLRRATTGRSRMRFRAASGVVVPRGPPGRRSGSTMVAVSVLRI
jgi:hypothetical protein